MSVRIPDAHSAVRESRFVAEMRSQKEDGSDMPDVVVEPEGIVTIESLEKRKKELEQQIESVGKLPFGLSVSALQALGVYACYMLNPLLASGAAIASQNRDRDGESYMAEAFEAALIALSFFPPLAIKKMEGWKDASKQAQEKQKADLERELGEVKRKLQFLKRPEEAAVSSESHSFLGEKPSSQNVKGYPTDTTYQPK